MSVRRTTLNILTRPRLRDIALAAGVEFYANASRAGMLDSISRSHSIPFKAILAEYLRDELKLACQQLALDETGRDKTVLIRRLLAAERQTHNARESSASGNRNGRQQSQITRVSRSRGTSAFLDGVNEMEEPKVIAEPTTSEPQEEPSRVELVWPGKRREVDRVVLPFQCIEVVNESRATREAEKAMPLARTFKAGALPADPPTWRNQLIWGDNRYVLGSLLEHYAGKIDLIYIDPPFGTGQDFSFSIEVGGSEIVKEPSLIEEKAYRDTWGRGVSSYLGMLYERLVLLRSLLSERGSIFVHLDVHMGPYVKVLMDEVFGEANFQNEIAWYYYNKMHDSRKRLLPKAFDQILYYVKNKSAGTYRYVAQTEKRDEPVRQLKRVKVNGKMINARDEDGNIIYQEKDTRTVDTVWRIRCLQPANKREWVNYATQKPVDLIERILSIASEPGDLVLDAFVGSGTAAVAAERQGRRWIAVDLGRYSIHVTRKRLLEEEGCRPFEVLNLGKYERQYWQGVTFGKGHGQQKALHEYVRFVLELYHAEPTAGLANIHGQRSGCMIHIGAADSPVTLAEIREAVDECKKINQAKLDILGWEWEMGLHDVIEAESKRAGVKLRLLQIPRECMDQRAVDAGDVHFYELSYLEVEAERRKGSREVRINLKNFVIPSPELIPDDVRSKIKKWSDFIDYWSVDFEFNEDVFHNQWQDYEIEIPQLSHTYSRNYKDISAFDVSTLPAGVVPLNWKPGDPINVVISHGLTEVQLAKKSIAFDPDSVFLQDVLASLTQSIIRTAKLGCQFKDIYPLVEAYVAQRFFGSAVDLNNTAVARVLGRHEVGTQFIRIVAESLGKHSTQTEQIKLKPEPIRLSETRAFIWRRRQCDAKKTIFNKFACFNAFEEEFGKFLDNAKDVEAFAKLAEWFTGFGLEYLSEKGSVRLYYPDFVVRVRNGTKVAMWVIETKGREDWDTEVPRKDAHAEWWCEQVTKETGIEWRYAKLPYRRYHGHWPDTFAALVESLKPAPDLPLIFESAEEEEAKVD